MITVISCLLLAVAPGTVTGLVASALIGLVLLTALPVILTMVEQRAGDAGGTATGLVWLAGNAGGIVVALAVQAGLDRPWLGFVIMAVGDGPRIAGRHPPAQVGEGRDRDPNPR